LFGFGRGCDSGRDRRLKKKQESAKPVAAGSSAVASPLEGRAGKPGRARLLVVRERLVSVGALAPEDCVKESNDNGNGTTAKAPQAAPAKGIQVTDKALSKVRSGMAKEGISSDQGGLRLRTGGGCSGLSYKRRFDTQPRERDRSFSSTTFAFRRSEVVHLFCTA